MKKLTIMILSASLIIGILTIISNSDAQNKQGDLSIEEETQKALSIVEKLLTKENLATYGLRDAKQIKSLKPTIGIILNFISLESIKNHKLGDDIIKKIIPLNDKRVIPLNNGANGTELSIEIEKRNGTWEFSSFGKNNLSSAFSKKIALSSVETMPIWIPALKIEALGNLAPNGNLIVEIVECPNDEKLSSFKGKKISGDEFFNLLKPIANAYNGLPW